MSVTGSDITAAPRLAKARTMSRSLTIPPTEVPSADNYWRLLLRARAKIAAMSGDDLPQLDTRHAHPARVYNYWLGGKDNFAADREAAEQAIAANPGIKTDVRANRAFLTRVVRYLAGEGGVRQFLDIGTGLPVAGNTHQVAQEVAPDARIVYADNDRCKSGCAHARRTGQAA